MTQLRDLLRKLGSELVDISTALFLERLHVLDQWEDTILDKKMQNVKVVYHVPLPTFLNAS